MNKKRAAWKTAGYVTCIIPIYMLFYHLVTTVFAILMVFVNIGRDTKDAFKSIKTNKNDVAVDKYMHPEKLFRMHMSEAGHSYMSLPTMIKNTCIFTYFYLVCAAIAVALSLNVSGIYLIVNFSIALVLVAAAVKQAYVNFLFRKQMIVSFKAYLNADDVLPKLK